MNKTKTNTVISLGLKNKIIRIATLLDRLAK